MRYFKFKTTLKLQGNPARSIQGLACTEKRISNAKITETINSKIMNIVKLDFLRNDTLPRETIDRIKFDTKIEKVNYNLIMNIDM